MRKLVSAGLFIKAFLAGALLVPQVSSAQSPPQLFYSLYGASGLSTSIPTSNTISAYGWSNLGDNGGGLFKQSSAPCQNSVITMALNSANQYWSTGNPQILLTTYSGVSPSGLYVTANNAGLAQFAAVIGFVAPAGSSNGSITLAVPPTSSNTSSSTLTLTAENGGQVVSDGSGTSQTNYIGACYKRLTSNFSQAEWGVGVVSGNDDTARLQNWINSNQPHIALPGTVTITSPLLCNDEQVIQGSASTAVAEDPSNKPSFVIKANNYAYQGYNGLSFSSVPGGVNAAMLTMLGSCGLHSVGLNCGHAGSWILLRRGSRKRQERLDRRAFIFKWRLSQCCF